MAEYGWIITKDFSPEPDAEFPSNANALGMTGPRDIPADIYLRLISGEGDRFQMRYDDTPDGDEYPEYPTVYEGRCIVDQPPGYDLSEDHFGPLTDFGTPNVGAAYIFYWHTEQGEWIQL